MCLLVALFLLLYVSLLKIAKTHTHLGQQKQRQSQWCFVACLLVACRCCYCVCLSISLQNGLLAAKSHALFSLACLLATRRRLRPSFRSMELAGKHNKPTNGIQCNSSCFSSVSLFNANSCKCKFFLLFAAVSSFEATERARTHSLANSMGLAVFCMANLEIPC